MERQLPLGYFDVFSKRLYSSIRPCHSWDKVENSKRREHGVISNFDFSPGGSLLLAGCRNSTVLMFDPLNRKLVNAINNAHDGWVTHVKFLNSRTFATGGNDKSVYLWDIRHLKRRFGALSGHSEAVGNIEVSSKNGLLVTSGLDGIINTWNLKNYMEKRNNPKKVFSSSDLLRMRLTPDASKMILSTARGYLIIVHNLDLCTLARDLRGFTPDKYQITSNRMVTSWSSNFLSFFSHKLKNNRVELITDFNNLEDTHVVSSLEIHPQGWSALTRSMCFEWKQEWTCLHDIQEREPSSFEESGDERCPSPEHMLNTETLPPASPGSASSAEGWSVGGEEVRVRGKAATGHAPRLPSPHAGARSGEGHEEEAGAPSRDNAYGGCSASERPGGTKAPAAATSSPVNQIVTAEEREAMLAHSADFSSSNSSPFSIRGPKSKRRFYKPLKRTTHSFFHHRTDKWYVEELGFSPDGRLMCFPSGCGVRLIAFSPECSEQTVLRPGKLHHKLYQLARYDCHGNYVFCTKFSPCHCLIVSGCGNGNICWHQPVL